ncbi:Ig-like domain-containing protein [Neobacillus sp. LXY-1]
MNPSNATDNSLTWKSSNPSVVTVEANGKVHAVGYGLVVITTASVQILLK